MSDRLRRLHADHGQSPWLDNLQRGYLTGGTLRKLINDGVRGLTSNPTIFQKAIQGSTDYDDQFREEISRGRSPEQAYWTLVTSDIRDAAAEFSAVHRESGGQDGFVSVEIDPRLARDGARTLEAARHLRESIDLPNVMIKIPATVESLPAIRTLVSEGCHVNVTLIFGLERHARVMEAYISGLEDRAAAGLSPAGVAGVASFFISRVDSEIDRVLAASSDPAAQSLLGTAAVNQARLAYAAFADAFSGPRWQALASAGASVQRPLWASTSTKNPAYPDTLYVDELIGPDTVNTLPDATLSAFADHGTLSRTIDKDIETARLQWAALASVGVDIGQVEARLEQEGVASFIASFEDLLGALAAKAAAMGTS